MNFEVDRYSSAWAHIALCADLTWAAEPPDEFVIANQRLWAQHCRVSQALQGQALKSHTLQTNSPYELTEKRSSTSQILENGNSSSRRSVKDVIPESRLAQFYGNFYYDELREKCYTNTYDKSNGRGYNGQGCENSDLTECWMLPEVEYWFRKLVEEPSERGMVPRRLRQYRILGDSDFERWDLTGTRSIDEEAALAARVRSVRSLWSSPRAAAPTRPASPLPAPGKVRARRRQPRWLASLAPPPPTYCLEAPAQLFCDPTCKFQFDSPRLPQLTECQRAMGRLSASVQALMRASAARCPPYRGTNVSRYAPTSQRSARCPDRRYGVWWARDRPCPRLDHRFHLTHIPHTSGPQKTTPIESELIDVKSQETADTSESIASVTDSEPQPSTSQQSTDTLIPDSPRSTLDQLVTECQLPTPNSTAMDIGLSKRLYSTVLSAPPTINLTSVGCVRLSQNQKMVTPGLLKLNPNIVLPRARLRAPNADKKFDELEKEALEQYKPSDESIDTKFSELEKQAVEQYSTSNSNTSCSSGNSVEKKNSSAPLGTENEAKNRKQAAKARKEKAVDSVVIYSQNFPDLKAKRHTSVTNLKNFQAPLRGEKKDQTHRSNKSLRSLKNKAQRAASDTDYDSREKGSHNKGAMRWTLHMVPPKKRHLTVCVSDFSSDEEANGALRAGARAKSHVAGKVKLSAHGGGDLNHIIRKP